MQYLKQPKIKIDVVIHIEGDKPQDYLIFLESISKLHQGAQKLEEFLNSDMQYIPAIHKSTDQFKFLNKKKILWAGMKSIPEIEAANENRIAGIIKKIGVSVEGFDIEGTVEIMLPPEKSRITDYINQTDTFFEVISDQNIYVCNKDQIGSVFEIKDK